MPEHLTVTDEDATRVIAMLRPEKKNAITQDMYRAMSDAINGAQNEPAIRCILITGGAGVFTAGNDLEDFLKDGTASADAPRKSNAIKFLYALAHNAKPIVAAVEALRSASAPPSCSIATTSSPPPGRPSPPPSSISGWFRKAPPAC